MSESDRKTWRWRLIFAMVGLGAVFDCQHFLVALLFFFICRGVALNAALALWSDEPAEDDQAEELAALKLENLRLLKLLSPQLEAGPNIENPVAGPCGCRACRREALPVYSSKLPQFIACEVCGNKRCPHATDHRLACTHSNEPGQAGSVFGGIALDDLNGKTIVLAARTNNTQ